MHALLTDLYTAIHDAAIACPGGIEGLADYLQSRPKTLRNRLAPGVDSHRPTVVDMVAVLERAPALLAAVPLEILGQMFGGQFVTRPSVVALSLSAAALDASALHGEMIRAVTVLIADPSPARRLAARASMSAARSAILALENSVATADER